MGTRSLVILGAHSTTAVLVGYFDEALEERFRGTLKFSTELMTTAYKLRIYADLLRQIHSDLRVQHPEWIQPNGESPTCDSYEARLMELLVGSVQSASSETPLSQTER
jgi:hypothetical protein